MSQVAPVVEADMWTKIYQKSPKAVAETRSVATYQPTKRSKFLPVRIRIQSISVGILVN
jgi:hypothetical protein